MQKYFKIVLNEANKAYRNNEIPVGAVIVKNNKIVAKAHNNRQKKQNIIGHAEVLCIIKAEKKLKDWRLDGCELYVNLEPCEMCKLIINESRINKVYFLNKQKNNKKIVENNIFSQTNDCENLQKNSEELLKIFFKKLRNKIIK